MKDKDWLDDPCAGCFHTHSLEVSFSVEAGAKQRQNKMENILCLKLSLCKQQQAMLLWHIKRFKGVSRTFQLCWQRNLKMLSSFQCHWVEAFAFILVLPMLLFISLCGFTSVAWTNEWGKCWQMQHLMCPVNVPPTWRRPWCCGVPMTKGTQCPMSIQETSTGGAMQLLGCIWSKKANFGGCQKLILMMHFDCFDQIHCSLNSLTGGYAFCDEGQWLHLHWFTLSSVSISGLCCLTLNFSFHHRALGVPNSSWITCDRNFKAPARPTAPAAPPPHFPSFRSESNGFSHGMAYFRCGRFLDIKRRTLSEKRLILSIGTDDDEKEKGLHNLVHIWRSSQLVSTGSRFQFNCLPWFPPPQTS